MQGFLYALKRTSLGTGNLKTGVAIKYPSYARRLNRIRGINMYPRTDYRFQATETCCYVPTVIPLPLYGNKRMNMF